MGGEGSDAYNRGDLGVASVNGKIYAIGGLTASRNNSQFSWDLDYNAKGWIVGLNEEYDPANGYLDRESFNADAKI